MASPLRRMSGPLQEFFMPPCTKVDPDIFIAHRKILQAKRICLTCPKDCRSECLKGALAVGERLGVRGGLSSDDRADLQARLDRKSGEEEKACGTDDQ